MVIRSGFVSNSSSTSFLLLGTCIEDSNILGFLKRLLKSGLIPPESDWHDVPKEYKSRLTDPDPDIWGEFDWRSLPDLMGLTGWVFEYDPDDYSLWVGYDMASIESTPDITFGQLKDSIRTQFKALGISAEPDLDMVEINT